MRPFEPIDGPQAGPRLSFDAPQPFLEQGRAQTSLRRELATLLEAIEARVAGAKALDSDHVAEVSSFPNRIIARIGLSATTFSWIGGRLGGISDGYLLVIEWSGLAAKQRGAQALKSATPCRETSYRPEAADAASWGWRGDAQAPACSTLDLVEHWLDATLLPSTPSR